MNNLEDAIVKMDLDNPEVRDFLMSNIIKEKLSSKKKTNKILVVDMVNKFGSKEYLKKEIKKENHTLDFTPVKNEHYIPIGLKIFFYICLAILFIQFVRSIY